MTTTQNIRPTATEEYCEDCGHVYDTCVNERGECTDAYSIDQETYWD
jgi:hypothetical protein